MRVHNMISTVLTAVFSIGLLFSSGSFARDSSGGGGTDGGNRNFDERMQNQIWRDYGNKYRMHVHRHGHGHNYHDYDEGAVRDRD